LAAQAQGAVAAALREMQGGAATSGALVVERMEPSANKETLMEPVEQSGRSPSV
jgi:1-acyl-sn-glycerol-3-phosphate acyltransferase